MAEGELTDERASVLLTTEKWRAEDVEVHFPAPGSRIEKGVISVDYKDRFILTINRCSKKNPGKVTYQLRTTNADILLRLDIEGPDHGNPDGTIIPCPHLHIYRQGYADKWAYPLPPELSGNLHDLLAILNDFMTYCVITKPPYIVAGIFS